MENADNRRVIGRTFHRAERADDVGIRAHLGERLRGKEVVDAPADVPLQRMRHAIVPERELARNISST